MTKTGIYVFTAIFVIIVIGLIAWRWESGRSNVYTEPTQTSTVTTSDTHVPDRSISDGIMKVSYSGDEFGLATNPGQILTHSYIPPCDENFNYCLYYIGDEYKGTNYESAGVRIQKRADLAGEQLCLNTPPTGFSSATKPAPTTSTNTYSSDIFSNVGTAAAGHYATDSLYRLFVRASATCYEFETRVGQTQFQNFPTGSIREFTATDQDTVIARLDLLLSRVTLPSGESNLFHR